MALEEDSQVAIFRARLPVPSVFLSAHASEIAALVSETQSLYSDAKSQSAVRAFVKDAVTNEPFLKALSGVLVKATASLITPKATTASPLITLPTPSLNMHQAFALSSWTCSVLSALKPDSKKAISKLVEIHSSLIDQLALISINADTGSAGTSWRAAIRPSIKLIRKSPHLLTEHLDQIKSSSSIHLPTGSIRLVQELGKLSDPASMTGRSDLLSVFCDKVIGGRERPGPHSMSTYHILLQSLSAEDLTSKIIPALSRALKRVPEVAVASLSGLAKISTADLSDHALELLAVVLTQLRSKESIRPLAIECISMVTRRIHSTTSLASIVSLFTSPLVGAAPEVKIKAPAERIAVITALTALSDCPLLLNPPSTDEVSRVVSVLSDLFKDESNEEVKLSLLSCLSSWMPLMVSSLSSTSAASTAESWAAHLSSSAKDPKENIRKGSLRSLSTILHSLRLKSPSPLLSIISKGTSESCTKIVTEATTKPAMRVEGLLAILCLSESDQSMDKILSPTLFVKGDAPLVGPATVVKVTSSEGCISVTQLVGSLLSHRLSEVESSTLTASDTPPSASVAALCRLLSLLMVHYCKQVRKEARAASRRALSFNPDLCSLLSDEMRSIMAHSGSGWSAGVPLSPLGAWEDHSLTPNRLSDLFARAVHSIVPPSFSSPGPSHKESKIKAELLAKLMLASHHPVISAPRGRGAAGQGGGPRSSWLQIYASLDKSLSSSLPTLASDVAHHLTQPLFNDSATRYEIDASCVALGSLMATCPEAAFDPIYASLTSLLDRSDYDALTPLHLDIYDTPNGVLCSERAQVGIFSLSHDHEVKKQKGKKSKRRDGSRAFVQEDDDDDEEEDVAPVKKPSQPVQKGGGGGGGPKDAAFRQAEQRRLKLEEEVAIRSHVHLIKQRIERGLAALSGLVSGHRSFSSTKLEELQGLCLPFLSSDLVASSCFNTVLLLSSCLPSPLGSQSSSLSLASSLRLIVLSKAREEEEKAQMDASKVAQEAAEAEGLDPFLTGAAQGYKNPSLTPRGPSRAELVKCRPLVDFVHSLKLAIHSKPALHKRGVDDEDLNDQGTPSRPPVGHHKRPLSPAAYRFIFPVLQAVLSSPGYTPLHDDAMHALAMHCDGGGVPIKESLEALHHTLGVMLSYKDRIPALLVSLCENVREEEEVAAAIQGLLSPHGHVRTAALAALPSIPLFARGLPPSGDIQKVELFISRHDLIEANVATAEALWQSIGATLPPSYASHMIELLVSAPGGGEGEGMRGMVARSLSSAIKELPETSEKTLALLLSAYCPLQSPISQGSTLNEAGRLGVALGLKTFGGDLKEPSVMTALDFLIRRGLADRSDAVREAMVQSGMSLVDHHGASLAPQLVTLFETFLDKKQHKASAVNGGSSKGVKGSSSLIHHEEERYDLVRCGVVVFLGTLAKHLPSGDSKRQAIIETLIQVLATPSEGVQRSVSTCLTPLVQSMSSDKEYVQGLVYRLMDVLSKGATYGERRGGAFGLSGVVKGLGIMAVKNYGVMDTLKSFVEDKKEASAREGALLAFELLSEKLGKLFEPYIIYILPLLLGCFGDVVPHVRTATEDASRMIMGHLTASGVKLVLPTLLKGLEDKAWRTKQGSVQLLGSMAHCAPKQLGACLPSIVPRLSEVLSDPHPKVQAAAQEALQEVGSVIRNPEVQTLVPSLLNAISDPNGKTRACLDVLLETVFVNTIDAPSLALIVPVVHRGLRDRAGDTKRRAGRIVGNMCTLVNDPKDMTPYVPLLMPELQKSLVDPLPEVRAVSARAMGSLLKGMGADAFSDLVPWLMALLRSEGSSVERGGAAQGLAEVFSVLGTAHMEALLPEVLEGCRHSRSCVREGHITLFQYLPITLEMAFQPYIGKVLPAILDGLADENEGVREASLSAGRIFVDHYATSALSLILPAVEQGVFDNNWRIRQSSILLMGKLLFKVVGASGNIVVDGGSDDEGAAEESYGEAIINALGMERRNQVLSRLYVCRSDPQYTVRSEALHVWKTIVVNTPRTLQQILVVLMTQMIASMASPSEDRRVMAARCMGELCRKMGERVIARVIPILRDNISSPDAATRQGVCLGLKEVLENINKHQLAEHMSEILPTVQAALTDQEAGVREAAGEAFSILFKGGPGGGGGAPAVDQVVPTMVNGLEAEKTYEESLEGLRVILIVRPTVFNFVLPRLMKMPLSVHNLKALAVLAPAAGAMLHGHIGSALPKLLSLASLVPDSASSGGETSDELRSLAAKEACCSFALSVGDEGLHLLIPELHKGLEDPERRKGTSDLISHFCSHSRGEEVLEKAPQLIDSVLALFGEEDPATLLSLWKAMESLCQMLPKEDHPSYIKCIKDAVASAVETERRKRKSLLLRVQAEGGRDATARGLQRLSSAPLHLRGFCVPQKSLSPILPIYLAGVLQGSSPEVREMAAEGLGDLVEATHEDTLRPFAVQITGPLIRVIGDRHPGNVKAAILTTLGLMVAKAGQGLKPFVPQLQTTFVKCLSDPMDAVRGRAVRNLATLSKMSLRVDQLANELANGASTAAELQVQESYLKALEGLFVSTGDRLSSSALKSIGDQLRGLLKIAAAAECDGPGDELRSGLASCLGAHAGASLKVSLASKEVSVDQGLSEGLEQAILSLQQISPNPSVKGKAMTLPPYLSCMTLASTALHLGGVVRSQSLSSDGIKAVIKTCFSLAQAHAKDADVSVRAAAGRAAVRIAAADSKTKETMTGCLNIVVALLGPDQSPGVQHQTLIALKWLIETLDGDLEESRADGEGEGEGDALEGALDSYWSVYLPSLCSILLNVSSGPTKSACERTLRRALRLDQGLEGAQRCLEGGPGPTVKTALSESAVRRLHSLNEEEDGLYALSEDY